MNLRPCKYGNMSTWISAQFIALFVPASCARLLDQLPLTIGPPAGPGLDVLPPAVDPGIYDHIPADAASGAIGRTGGGLKLVLGIGIDPAAALIRGVVLQGVANLSPVVLIQLITHGIAEQSPDAGPDKGVFPPVLIVLRTQMGADQGSGQSPDHAPLLGLVPAGGDKQGAEQRTDDEKSNSIHGLLSFDPRSMFWLDPINPLLG